MRQSSIHFWNTSINRILLLNLVVIFVYTYLLASTQGNNSSHIQNNQWGNYSWSYTSQQPMRVVRTSLTSSRWSYITGPVVKSSSFTIKNLPSYDVSSFDQVFAFTKSVQFWSIGCHRKKFSVVIKSLPSQKVPSCNQKFAITKSVQFFQQNGSPRIYAKIL